MKGLFTVLIGLLAFGVQAQSSIKGILMDSEGAPVPFANVAIYGSADSNMVKVETSDVNGAFHIKNSLAESYNIAIIIF